MLRGVVGAAVLTAPPRDAVDSRSPETAANPSAFSANVGLDGAISFRYSRLIYRTRFRMTARRHRVCSLESLGLGDLPLIRRARRSHLLAEPDGIATTHQGSRRPRRPRGTCRARSPHSGRTRHAPGQAAAPECGPSSRLGTPFRAGSPG